MRSGGMALNVDCREGGMFAFSDISLKLHTDVRGNTDDNHTDMGHIVHNGQSAFLLIAVIQSE